MSTTDRIPKLCEAGISDFDHAVLCHYAAACGELRRPPNTAEVGRRMGRAHRTVHDAVQRLRARKLMEADGTTKGGATYMPTPGALARAAALPAYRGGRDGSGKAYIAGPRLADAIANLVADGVYPSATRVAEELSVGRDVAARLLRAARAAGTLPPIPLGPRTNAAATRRLRHARDRKAAESRPVPRSELHRERPIVRRLAI